MKIDLEFLKSELRKEVTEKRYIHTIGVAETGKKLAAKYGAELTKVEIASILHDFAKYRSKEELIRCIKDNKDLPDDLLNYSQELWHGPVASIIIQDIFQINDEEIINAIRYHTTGREEMTIIEKIVCLADYIEPSRDFSGVDQLRKLADIDLDQALLAALDGTIKELIKGKNKIYPLTVKARNYLMNTPTT